MTGAPWVWNAVGAAIVAAVVCGAAAPFASAAGRRWRVLDRPDGHRKHHAAEVPRTGGVVLASGLAAGCLCAFLLGAAFPLPLVAAAVVIFALGVIDDVRGCTAAVKLAVQAAAAAAVVGGGAVAPLAAPGLPPAAVGVLAVIWLVGITNAINMVDGVDGLAGSMAIVFAGVFAVFAAAAGDAAAFAAALALAGACGAFLPWNWRPARLFLGDAGSLTVGFVLAWLSLAAAAGTGGAMAVFLPPLVLGIPAFDVLAVMCVRFRQVPAGAALRERVRRVLRGDRLHLHHLILARCGPRTVVLGLCGLAAAFGLLALDAVHWRSLALAAAALLAEAAAVVALRRRKGVTSPPEEILPVRGPAPSPADEPAPLHPFPGRAPSEAVGSLESGGLSG